ncbi:UDP-N-acetylmuramoyl-L-alanyl-D-glutamate--2,6-diaminopimelate ligase [Pseudoroseomonas ludipueritiae]|uniref:UDP-N-acetylmuramoyl-L-alanyl-D-glutamate--2,6-diaminopimelate ligase n=1 Tax=Pseudoroseomonas ludipueritiae TaxID=198093 RepID=A0ABR7REU5_9PROT|nr:UDP-N-acetylmuramoyl-L-alanyl-D-glutamate--2,6-diaminopimelate ligase [Pseudoroseomonas ludipueritiae]MBC9180394.1 UDP-N-acetylmuramoyl-L-alanyl-D-glutamate--2,6-diaminopimelate ligase [Pseudoroseomonas ludipueritiae]MCG7361573.1 UDP-N-acetylmuramoyl-L-alanyl-D-glutamate--2,6-diaminopimelate ligase [Roseomonas sp. ACRSG]
MRHAPGLHPLQAAVTPDILGLTADSRAVQPGYLFAALPGTRSDGRAFIADAVARGAGAVLAPEGTDWPAGVPPRPMLTAADARRALAQLAAGFYGLQPATVVAVTGTNGKTSTVDFLRQIWTLAGKRAASLGTLGLRAPDFPEMPSLTTPDPVKLHETLAELARGRVTHAALEASSHGLEQRRLDGLRLAAAGFSNLTRDHLDYHGDMASYAAAKLRLFDTLLEPGAAAVASADMDAELLARLRGIVARRGLRLHTVGEQGEAIRLLRQEALPEGQVLALEIFGRRAEVSLPLPGRFQADNVMMAAALAVAAGLPADQVLALLPKLSGVRGRMELAARLPNGAAVYVDYAHTPDALERLLKALRPHATGRLHVVFGAGGDRDPGKRPLMGEVASRLADHAIVTDDNPRTEDPAAIRAAVRAGMSHGEEVGDRAAAIAHAIEGLAPGDVLAVAGKGHESGQTIGTTTLPFDDVETVRRVLGQAA